MGAVTTGAGRRVEDEEATQPLPDGLQVPSGEIELIKNGGGEGTYVLQLRMQHAG
jgi:hypothetical protein